MTDKLTGKVTLITRGGRLPVWMSVAQKHTPRFHIGVHGGPNSELTT